MFGEDDDVAQIGAGALVEGAAAGDEAKRWLLGGAVDLLGGEFVLVRKHQARDQELGHGAVGAFDLNQVPWL